MNALILKPNGIYNTADLNKSHISLDECEQIVEGTVQSVYTIRKLMRKNILVLTNKNRESLNFDNTLYLMDGGQIKDVLKGNILFIKFDNYGDWFGLSKKDINYVKSCIKSKITELGDNNIFYIDCYLFKMAVLPSNTLC